MGMLLQSKEQKQKKKKTKTSDTIVYIIIKQYESWSTNHVNIKPNWNVKAKETAMRVLFIFVLKISLVHNDSDIGNNESFNQNYIEVKNTHTWRPWAMSDR
jgi:hypothetical protein